MGTTNKNTSSSSVFDNFEMTAKKIVNGVYLDFEAGEALTTGDKIWYDIRSNVTGIDWYMPECRVVDFSSGNQFVIYESETCKYGPKSCGPQIPALQFYAEQGSNNQFQGFAYKTFLLNPNDINATYNLECDIKICTSKAECEEHWACCPGQQ